MNPATPTALILGIEHFVAKKLAAKILANDINVIGVGDYVTGWSESENLIIKNELAEVGDFRVNYVFDFRGDPYAWKKAETDEAKLVVISVNNKENKNKIEKEIKIWKTVNWRIVESYGVYGPGMPEQGFVAGAMRQAVENKNLILPSLSLTYRLLAVDDLVEAILRSIFLSGTEEEEFLVVGEKTNSEEVAKTLIDEAKMTRFKVMQSEISVEKWADETVERNWAKLRWQPEINFKEGVKETLQYFFSKIDEEKRKNKDKIEFESKKEKLIEKIGDQKEEKERTPGQRRYEVMVEEKQPEEEIMVPAKKESEYKEPEIEKKEIKEDVKETIIEEFEEIKPLKNYRPEPKTETVALSEIKKESVMPVVKQKEIIEEETVKEEMTKPEPVKEQPILMKIPEKKKREKKGRKMKGWKMWLMAILILLLSVPMNWLVTGYVAVRNVKKVETLIKNKDYIRAGQIINKTSKGVKRVDTEIDDFGLNAIGVGRNYQTILRVIEEVLNLETKTIGLVSVGDKFSGAIFKNEEIDWYKEFDTVKVQLEEVTTDLGLLQARLNGNWSWAPGVLRSWVQKEERNLEEIRAQLELAKKAIGVLPTFLGVDGKQKDYMVLFQNESELRPTGGFIGSYGILSFKGGKLIDMEVKDIYEADGQLKGHVEPPEELKTYLGEAGWFMRDANWQASFPAAAADIQWFYEKELNQKVDGVIGIDLAVVKSMLGVVGQVTVPDFKEVITKDNVYEQAESYAENKFFPGSNQKASFLGGLGKQLFEEIKTLTPEKQGQLLLAMLDMLEKNEIQVALNDKTAATILANLGWDGSIYQGKCSQEKCLSDYLYVVEANVGVNKANYFLYRNMEQVIEIKNNSIDRDLKINYENTAKSTAWPGGDYKNYMRIYLPKEVNINEISLIDGDNPNSKKTYSNEEIKIREVYGKKEVGFLAIVPTAKKRIVEVKYSTPINLTDKDKFSYLYFIQRQPGYGETGLVTLVSFPDGWQPMQVQPAANLVGGKLLFNLKLDRDIKMGVELGK